MPGSIEREIAENPRVRDLCRAIGIAARDDDLALRFLRDLLSFKELQDIANRWAAARLLMAGQTQTRAAHELGLSTKTVSEVAQWVHGPYQTRGYWEVLGRFSRGSADGRASTAEGPGGDTRIGD